MGKHTNTPWHAGENSVPTELARGSHTILIESDGYIIAHVSSWKNDPETAAEAFANANLIAAAPDLLEALEAAVFDIENTHPLDSNYSWADAARKAIARAKGESQ